MRKIFVTLKNTLNMFFLNIFSTFNSVSSAKNTAFSHSNAGIFSNDYITNRRPQLPGVRDKRIKTKGRFYDIQKIFDDINAKHFDGKSNSTISYSKFGGRTKASRKCISLVTYSRYEELIRIHPILDSNVIPQFFIEYIIHHALLHEFIPPIERENGGFKVHHDEFIKAEYEIPNFQKAIKWFNYNKSMFFTQQNNN